MAKLNVKLLRKIQKHILKEPRRLDMAVLKLTKSNLEADEYGMKYFPPCGTVACIAGWACILGGKPRYGIPRAAKLLGLGEYKWRYGEENLAASVFFCGHWPEPFRSKYYNAKSKKSRAKITAKRIDYLIRNGE